MKNSLVVRALFLACCLSCAQACRRPEAPPPAPPVQPAPSMPLPAPVPADAAKPTPPPEDATAAIEHLLATIASSPLIFIRNGTEHTGAKAAEHIRSKYDYYKKDIATPEDFIVKAASKSELSGKPYKVRLADGTELFLSDWLTARLAEWRKQRSGV